MSQKATLDLITRSTAETRALGEHLGTLLRPGQVVALSGPLGAGKTCLAQGIARGLGVSGAVTSPTFIIVNQYHAAGSVTLYHIDCYRFADSGTPEAVDIGLPELLEGNDICVVEWAERIAALLPSEHVKLALSPVGPDARRVSVAATGEQYIGIVEGLADWRAHQGNGADPPPDGGAAAL